MPEVICADCGSPMVLRDSRYGKFYGCSRFPECRGAHGAHPDGRPLGVPATAETKQLRIQAHAAFDRLWQGGGMKRKEAYRWLQKALGIPKQECHIGSFDAATTRRVIEVCNGMAPSKDA